jgi:hypothetical protein
MRIGPTVVDSFTMAPGGTELRQTDIPVASLGGAETIEMRISVDKTFVPAALPALRSADPRELGIRVFRVFVEPL